jgi:hypothetical protein
MPAAGLMRLTTFTLKPVNADVVGVHAADGLHVGNLKHIGTLWKFKAIGYDDAGGVEPGGGPLTDRHNTVFTAPDADAVNQVFSAAFNTVLDP